MNIKDLIEKYLGTKNKKIAAGVVAALVIAAIGTGTYFALSSNDPEFKLKNKSVTVEYGEKISTEFNDLVDTEGLSKDVIAEWKKETKITSDVKNEVVKIKDEAGNVTGTEEKDYPAVGKYTVNVAYKDDKYKQSAEVKDTVAPAVTLKDGAEYIQINTGTDLNTFDFASMIVVEDLSEITKTNIDFSQVNSGVVGNYPIAVTAEDKYGNTDTTNVYAIVADAGTDITALVEEVQEQKATDEKKKAEEKKESTKTSSKSDSSSNSNKNNTSDKNDNGNSGSTGNNSNTGNTGNSGNNSSSGNTGNTGGSSKPEHTHSWQAVTKTVHHDEVGHYETQVVQAAWDEPVYEGHVFCVKCNRDFGAGDSAVEKWSEHADSCGGRYTVRKVQIDTIHHDAVTKQVWIVDQVAWDETVITGYKCSCGATK